MLLILLFGGYSHDNGVVGNENNLNIPDENCLKKVQCIF